MAPIQGNLDEAMEDLEAGIADDFDEALPEAEKFANAVQGVAQQREPPTIREVTIAEHFDKMTRIRDQLAERIHRERIAVRHQYDNAVADQALSHQRSVTFLREQHEGNLRGLADEMERRLRDLDTMQEKL